MIFNFFQDGFGSFFKEMIDSTKESLGEVWNIIHSFLVQYFSDNIIYLFIGAMLLIISLVLISNAMNHK